MRLARLIQWAGRRPGWPDRRSAVASASAALEPSVRCRAISSNPKHPKVKQLAAQARTKAAPGYTPPDPDPADQFPAGWRVVTAAVLERVPIVTPDKDPVEQLFEDRALEIRNEQSRPIPREVIEMEIPGGGDILAKMKEEVIFQPAPRRTQADEDNDRKSLDRQLTEKLYFIIKRTKQSKFWQFPQRASLPDELDTPLRNSAEKALRVVLGADPWVHFLGNAPCAHLEHVYSEEYQNNNQVYGAKIFFYRAYVIRNDSAPPVRQAADFAWVTKAEIADYFSPEYHSAVRRMLVP